MRVEGLDSPGAHPRVCGENDELAAHGPGWVGSSPRVRGKPGGQGITLIGLRLIPACAGKTRCRW